MKARVLLLVVMIAIGCCAAQNPVPLVNNPLVPSSAVPGGAGFTLTVNGTGFVAGSVVNWNGVSLATTFVSGSQLTAMVPAVDIAAAGTATVNVVSPGSGSGGSNAAWFAVRKPFPSVSFDQQGLTAGNDAISPVTTDFNSDGILDIASLASTDTSVAVLLGKGDGTFQPSVEYPVAIAPEALVTGDFDGDGKLDLATFDGDVSVLLGNGDGTFQSHKDSPSGLFGSGIATGDFNGDGKLDLAVAVFSPTGQVAIMIGNGDGTFQSPVLYPVAASAGFVAVGDYNSDGKLDLAVTGSFKSSVVAVLLGNGDGSFQNGVPYDTAFNPQAVIAADLNGDGKLDLIVKDSGISVLLGNSDGTFQPRRVFLSSSDDFVTVGDLNGDGKIDLIVPSTKTSAVFLGTGDGHFMHPGYFQTSGTSQGGAVGDFNGDGLIDIVTGNLNSSTLSVLPQVTAVLSDTLVNFGRIQIGTSATKNVKLMNIGSTTLRVARIGLEGADAADFTERSDCLAGVVPGAACDITIVFTPTATQRVKEARVAIRDSAVSVTQKIILQGAGTN